MDEGVGGAVGGVEEDDVAEVAAGGVDGEDDEGFFEDLFSNPAYQPYDLSASQIYDADGLRFNRDPFDALICAAARDLGLPLLTRDSDIAESGAVRVLW